MDPINYSVDVQTPFQAALQGYQAGAAIRTDQQQQQQQLAAQQQQAALQKAYTEAATNPTADNFSRLMMLDPKSSEGIQRAWTTRNTAQQQAHASDLLQWGAAIKSGKPQIAADQMAARADAMEQQTGAPTRESQALRAQAQVMREHPEFALGQIQALLSANPAGKDAAETLSKFGTEARAAEKAPGELRTINANATTAEAGAAEAGPQATAVRQEAQAKAQTAQIAAKYGEKSVLLELAQKGATIDHLVADTQIRREGNRIAAMSAAAAREGNALKRQELSIQVQAAQQRLDQTLRDKVADTESAATSIDNSLNTIQRIKSNKSLDSVLGTWQGRTDAYFNDEASDAIALIETLGSQAFLSQAANLKGMGALSNAEGEKLQSALTNLSRKQSEGQFRANLDEASRLLTKGRETLAKRTGVPVGRPDTPAAPGTRPALSSFQR